MTHPMVDQLRFTRSEFLRGIRGVNEEDASRRFLPMNCLSWNVGHLAWQEQRYLLHFGLSVLPFPEIDQQFAFGAPASTPSLKEMLAIWKAITTQTDPWLDSLTTAMLQDHPVSNGKPLVRRYGDMIQRLIYHYWYHTGENQAIRQMLGHSRLPVFVGAIDEKAPYRPEVVLDEA